MMKKKLGKSDFLKKGTTTTDFDILRGNGHVEFPTNIFPEDIEKIVEELERTAGYEKAVSAAGILFTVSCLIGNSKKVKIKNTWIDTLNLWLAIVGKRGTGKTPALNFVLSPLKGDEKRYGDEFKKAVIGWEKLGKGGKLDTPRPVRKQRFSSDTTMEALIVAMKDNPNGMGIYKDELAGFFTSMNRYSNSGGDTEFYLSAWSGGNYVKNRVSHDPITIDDIFLSIIGSVQPNVLKSIATEQNTQNGMIDRWLYIEMSDQERVFTLDDIPDSMMDRYSEYMESIKKLLENKQKLMKWEGNSLLMFKHGINKIEEFALHEDSSDAFAAYLEKMKVYFARFCGVLAVCNLSLTIKDEHVLRAYELIRFFAQTAKNIFIDFANQETIKAIFKGCNATSVKQKVIALLENLGDQMNSKEISNEVGCTPRYVNKIKKEYEDQK